MIQGKASLEDNEGLVSTVKKRCVIAVKGLQEQVGQDIFPNDRGRSLFPYAAEKLWVLYVSKLCFGLVAMLNKYCLSGDYDIVQIEIVLNTIPSVVKEGIAPLHCK